MSTTAPLQNSAAKSQPLSTSAHRGLLLQRKCACGSPTSSLSGECAECEGKKLQRSSLAIGAPGDRFEQEADRVADAVVEGKTASLSLSSALAGNVQREEDPKEKIREAQPKDFANALLQTQFGKELQTAIKQDKLVEGTADIAGWFISSFAGKVITGAVAVGALTALALEYKKLPHKELPAQIPEIPLDGVLPGWSVQIAYKGPMNQPTEASITVKYSEQAPKGFGSPSTAEKYRAETAHLAAADAKSRAGMTYKPGSPEDLRQKAEQGDEKRAAAKFAGGPDGDAMAKKYPGLKSPQPKPGEQLEMPKPSFGPTPPVILGDQLKYKLPTEKKKKEDEPALQRKDVEGTTEAMEHDAAPPIVEEVLHSPGQPLDAETRAFMEPRFGHDFSQVRVHSGAAAEQSARDVNAEAYTLGHNVVFGVGRFAPGTYEGRRLIAHELTHVVQQTRRVAGFPGQSTPGNLQRKPEAKEAKKKFKPGDCVRVNAVRLTLPNVPWGEPGYKVITQVGTEKGLNSLLKVERLLPGTDEYPRTPGVYEFTVLADDGKVKAGVGGGKLTGVADSVYVDLASCPTPPTSETTTVKAEKHPVSANEKPVEAKPLPSCSPPSECPEDFCKPFDTEPEAIKDRDANMTAILDMVGSISSKCTDLYREYLMGGSSKKDLTGSLASDFTRDSATSTATDFLIYELKKNPPSFPSGVNSVPVDIAKQIPNALKEIDNPNSNHKMEFTTPPGAPGLIAGGIGKNQKDCPVGKHPSRDDDQRLASGTADIVKNADGSFSVVPYIEFTVNDTIDFCPGNCGGIAAQTLGKTIQMSRYEATGISGDVPFTVRFPAPVGTGDDSE